jgi:hypothetical protein
MVCSTVADSCLPFDPLLPLQSPHRLLRFFEGMHAASDAAIDHGMCAGNHHHRLLEPAARSKSRVAAFAANTNQLETSAFASNNPRIVPP